MLFSKVFDWFAFNNVPRNSRLDSFQPPPPIPATNDYPPTDFDG